MFIFHGASWPLRLMLCGRWAAVTEHPKLGSLNPPPSISPQVLEIRHLRSRGPGLGFCRGSRGGSFPPLPASGGSRRPSLGWWPPPSGDFMCLLLRVCVSPLRSRVRRGRVQERTPAIFVIQLLEIPFLVLCPGSLAQVQKRDGSTP